MRKLTTAILLFLCVLSYGQLGVLVGNFSDDAIKQFRVDATGGTTYQISNLSTSGDLYIKWGDGSDTLLSNQSNDNISHTYTDGLYDVSFLYDESITSVRFFVASTDSLYPSFGKKWTNMTNFSSGLRATGLSFLIDSLGVTWESLTNVVGMLYGTSIAGAPPEMFSYDWVNLTGSVSTLFRNSSFTAFNDSFLVKQNMTAIRELAEFSDIQTVNERFCINCTSLTDAFEAFASASLQDTVDIAHIPSFEGNWDASFSSNPGLNYINLPPITGELSNFDAAACALTQDAVDFILDHFRKFYDPDEDGTAENPPTQDLTIDLSGGTNASPTDGASNDDKTAIENIFTTAGFTATISIN